MVASLFSVDEFLKSATPWDYVDSRLAGPNVSISQQELAKLHSVVDELDEAHLAMALAIAEGYAPELFAEVAAKSLTHPRQSVRIKAYRVIRAVPANSLSEKLKKAVAIGLLTCPEQVEFADALSRH